MKHLKQLFFLASLFSSSLATTQEQSEPAKVNTLLQFWTVYDDTATSNNQLNFRARRAEVRFSGKILPTARWLVMVDFAKSLKAGTVTDTNDNKVLQDLAVVFGVAENIELSFGQFKIPFLEEGLKSSTDLTFIERSYLGRTYADLRQPGAMLDFNSNPVRLRIMASNGQVSYGSATNNINDTNNAKDFTARVDYKVTDFTFGVASSYSDSTAGVSHRLGAEFGYSDKKMFSRLAYIDADDNSVKRKGMFVEVGYNFSDLWQAGFRFEDFNTTTGTILYSNMYSAVLNYSLLKNNAKVQLSFNRLNNFSGSNGSPVPAAGEGYLTLLNTQMSI